MEEHIEKTISNSLFQIYGLHKKGWLFWIGVLIFTLFLLWLFFGGGDYDFIGLDPMKIGVDSTKYINDHCKSLITKSNFNAPKITRKDLSQKDLARESKFTKSEIDRALGNHKQYKPGRISKGELKCKEALEEIFERPFYCVRPDFLKNPETGRNLELDLFNDELQVAVERNGIQHIKWPNYTGQSREDFIKQLKRDKFKLEMCDQNGIYLITVPHTVEEKDIKQFIIDNLPIITYSESFSESYDSVSYVD
uniref:Restriction endonuclease n=1 Tax=Pithovirus LCPAC302 TaxID=2506593 RepID=A0A481Z6S6_9VIRU|nr:MAG: restriction endonuclease [Pithovirus LCPAC302]